MQRNGAGVAGIFDAFLNDHRDLEARANVKSLDADDYQALANEIFESSHGYASKILEEIGPPAGKAWSDVGKILQQHDLHRRILLQSRFIEHAYRKPNGYAGDKDLMLIIYENADQGVSPYAVLKNRVYQGLPAAEAVRRRIKSIESRIGDLPAGSNVLSLASGPAREVDRFVGRNPGRHFFDLIDHDVSTIEYTSASISDERVQHVVGNAFDIIKGRDEFPARTRSGSTVVDGKFALRSDKYDFIYSAGLYDYISDSPSNPGRRARSLTKSLFALLKPGGRLLIGNFLAQSDENPHLMHHRLMMELYSEWNLIYRTPAEIFDFAAELPAAQVSIVSYNEFMDTPDPESGVIGFMDIQRLD